VAQAVRSPASTQQIAQPSFQLRIENYRLAFPVSLFLAFPIFAFLSCSPALVPLHGRFVTLGWLVWADTGLLTADAG
jgi:hypothetical protein